jgi:hypothetical protein
MKTCPVILLVLLLLLALLAVPASAAPVVVDVSAIGAFGSGADIGLALGFRIAEKPPDALVGGAWADIGLAGDDPYIGISTEVPVIAGLTGDLVKRIGVGTILYEGMKLEDAWRVVLMKSWRF